MKKRGFYIVLFALLMVVLFSPLVQQLWHPFTIKPLDGASEEVVMPVLSFEAYQDQTYQVQLEKFIAQHFGFHEPIIRLYNQYLWNYRKTYAQDVIIGKDKWLYGKMSVRDHYRQLSYDYAESNEALVAKFEKDLDRLKKVQQMLDERGTKLFVLICPAKDLIYPEHLPENCHWTMSDGLRAIEYYPKAFAENGINCLNLNDWFLQIKDTVSYSLFPKTGMHWSNIACAHAADTLVRYMEYLTGKNMPNLQFGAMYPHESYAPDNDLEKSMNLICEIKPNQNWYVPVSLASDSTVEKLNLITMGDSFFWNLCYTLPMDKLFNTYRYWYYFSTIFYDPDYTNVNQIDLLAELDRADVVMISLSATQLYEINHNFLSQALFKLSVADPSVIDDIIEGIKQNMRNNEPWLESLKEKAVQQGKTLEQVMDEDARYVFNQEPERYLD